jgi:hypothetical protein
MAMPRPSATGPQAGWWAWQGVLGGVIAGLIFAAFEMIAAALLMGPPPSSGRSA